VEFSAPRIGVDGAGVDSGVGAAVAVGMVGVAFLCCNLLPHVRHICASFGEFLPHSLHLIVLDNSSNNSRSLINYI